MDRAARSQQGPWLDRMWLRAAAQIAATPLSNSLRGTFVRFILQVLGDVCLAQEQTEIAVPGVPTETDCEEDRQQAKRGHGRRPGTHVAYPPRVVGPRRSGYPKDTELQPLSRRI